jgi:hypothetical protein
MTANLSLISIKEAVNMKQALRDAFNTEMNIAKKLYLQKSYAKCYSHLERAHILGQRNYIPHVVNHFWMCKVGFKQGDTREVMGQVVRMIMSIFSLLDTPFFHTVPVGNTGRARISPVKPMPVPEDLAEYFK